MRGPEEIANSKFYRWRTLKMVFLARGIFYIAQTLGKYKMAPVARTIANMDIDCETHKSIVADVAPTKPEQRQYLELCLTRPLSQDLMQIFV